ncbi:uncharacterized protein [Ptychodera flava]|uniref:uncharacterized protein n=1 Tax=Ptychodera flava TaxID=63121 RepID=UPI00396A0C84
MPSSSFQFLRGICNASQDSTKSYRVCVCLDRNGQPYGAVCRCVAGLGEACSHVGALLFAVEDFVAKGYKKLPDGPQCTEVLCKWISHKDSRVHPTTMDNVKIYKPGYGKNIRQQNLHAGIDDGRAPSQRAVDCEQLLLLRNRLLNNSVKVPASNAIAMSRFFNHFNEKPIMEGKCDLGDQLTVDLLCDTNLGCEIEVKTEEHKKQLNRSQ